MFPNARADRCAGVFPRILVQPDVRRDLFPLEELSHGQSDVSGDSSQEEGRMSRPRWKGDGGTPSVCMSELLMPTSLTSLKKSHCFEDGNDFRRLKDGGVAHG